MKFKPRLNVNSCKQLSAIQVSSAEHATEIGTKDRRKDIGLTCIKLEGQGCQHIYYLAIRIIIGSFEQKRQRSEIHV